MVAETTINRVGQKVTITTDQNPLFGLDTGEVITDTVPAILPATWSRLFIGRDDDSVSPSRQNWSGLIREVTILRQGSDDVGITDLYHQTAQLDLAFDEPPASDTIIDFSANDIVATCEDCPQLGVQGKLRNGVMFDGLDDQLTVPYNDNLSHDNLTLGLWVKPKAPKPVDQALVVKAASSGNNSNYGLYLNGNNEVIFRLTQGCTNNRQQVIGPTIPVGSWTHLVGVVQDAAVGWEMVLYINGSRYDSHTFTNQPPCTGRDAVSIGNHNSATAYGGLMDELFIYRYAWTTGQVKTRYDSQFNWYETSARQELIIDDQPPTVTLQLAQQLIAPQDVILAVHIEDNASPIKSVAVEADTGDIIGEPQLAGEGERSQILILTYKPAGAGNQQIRVTVADEAGHQTSETTSLTVDDSPPTPTLASQLVDQVVPAQASVRLEGTISDNLSQVDSLYVTLLDDQDNPVGNGNTYFATINDQQWQLNYPLTFVPTGRFRLEFAATDRLGNQATTRSDPFWLSGQGAFADLVYRTVTTAPLTYQSGSIPQLNGTVSLIPYPPQPYLHYHFEETTGQVSYDGTANHRQATCDDCPTWGQPGRYGLAAQFEATNRLTISQLSSLDGEMTLAAWIRPTSKQGEIITLGLPDDPAGQTFLRLNNGQYEIGTTESRLQIPMPDSDLNRWLHLVGVYEENSEGPNYWRLYRDGVELGAIETPTGPSDSSTAWQIGNGFTGLLDEVIMYDTALSTGRPAVPPVGKIFDNAAGTSFGVDVGEASQLGRRLAAQQGRTRSVRVTVPPGAMPADEPHVSLSMSLIPVPDTGFNRVIGDGYSIKFGMSRASCGSPLLEA